MNTALTSYVQKLGQSLQLSRGLGEQLDVMALHLRKTLQANGYICHTPLGMVQESSSTSRIWGRRFEFTDPATGAHRQALVATRLRGNITSLDEHQELTAWFAVDPDATHGLPAAWVLHSFQTRWTVLDFSDKSIQDVVTHFLDTLVRYDPSEVTRQLEDLLRQLDIQLAH